MRVRLFSKFSKQKSIYFALDKSLVRRHKLITSLVAGAHALALITAIAVSLLAGSNQKALAASYTWDGGGTTNNWSDCVNWSTNVCPVAADSVTFNSTNIKNSVVDASSSGSVASITITSGYTGTITLGRLFNSTNFTQSGGNFNGASYDLNLTGSSNFNLSGGIFTAPSSTFSIVRNFTISGGTFHHNNGTVNFTGTGTTSQGDIICNNASFNLVTFTQEITRAKGISSSCNLPLGANPTIPRISLYGTLTGTGTLTLSSSGANTFYTNAALSGFDGLVGGAVTVEGATLDLSNYSTVIMNNAFSLNSGSVLLPNEVDFNSTFALYDGSLTAASSQMTIAGSILISPDAIFNHNNGTVVFDGINTATLTCGNALFNRVEINHTTTNVKTVSSDCTFPLGNNPTVGRITLAGTLSGSGTLTLGTTSSNFFNSGATLSNFDELDVVSSLTISAGSFVAPSIVDINGSFTVSSGATFTAPSDTMTVAGALTINTGATFSHNDGTVIFDGAAATIACSNTVFNLVRIAAVSGATIKTINSDCNLPLGNNPTIGDNRITLNGTLTGTGTLTASYIILNAGASLSGFNGLVVNDLLSIGTDTNLSAYTPVDVGRFAQTAGTFTAPANMSVSSTFVIVGGTFAHNNGTLIFDGGSATLTCNNATFNLVALQHTTGGKLINSDCTLPLGHNPTITGVVDVAGTLSGTGTMTFNTGVNHVSGTNPFNGFIGIVSNGSWQFNNGSVTNLSTFNKADFNFDFILSSGSTVTMPSGTMTVAGNLTVSSGSTFIHNNGTVILDGVDQAIVGDTVFNNLTKTTTVPAILTFSAGSTTTVNGSLILRGTAANPLALLSSTPGTQWNINVLGTKNLRYLTVQDSNNISSDPMLAYDSEDSGNNINWQFLASPSATTSPVTNFGFAQASMATAAAVAQQQQNLRASFANIPGVRGALSELAGVMDKLPGGRGVIMALLKVAALGGLVLLSLGLIISLALKLRQRGQHQAGEFHYD